MCCVLGLVVAPCLVGSENAVSWQRGGENGQSPSGRAPGCSGTLSYLLLQAHHARSSLSQLQQACPLPARAQAASPCHAVPASSCPPASSKGGPQAAAGAGAQSPRPDPDQCTRPHRRSVHRHSVARGAPHAEQAQCQNKLAWCSTLPYRSNRAGLRRPPPHRTAGVLLYASMNWVFYRGYRKDVSPLALGCTVGRWPRRGESAAETLLHLLKTHLEAPPKFTIMLRALPFIQAAAKERHSARPPAVALAPPRRLRSGSGRMASGGSSRRSGWTS